MGEPLTKPERHHIDRRADDIVGADVGADDELLSTQAVAAWLGVSMQFLEIGRHKGYGPSFKKISSRCARYRRGDVLRVVEGAHARQDLGILQAEAGRAMTKRTEVLDDDDDRPWAGIELPMDPDTILAAALAYAARGWFVFPARPGEKKSYKSAEHSDGRKWGKTKDVKEIERDWKRWPDANVGIVTGPESGFWVVEADTKEGHGVDGIASLAALEQQHGALPPTLMAESPSGTSHLYFSWPTGGVKIINSASTIGPGIDVRGEGGMVIAPPSVKKDGSYRWINDLPVAEAPAWLIEAAR
jgi:hypothetical protein